METETPILDSINDFVFNMQMYIKTIGDNVIKIELPDVGSFEKLRNECHNLYGFQDGYNSMNGRLAIMSSSGIKVEVSAKEYNERYKIAKIRQLIDNL